MQLILSTSVYYRYSYIHTVCIYMYMWYLYRAGAGMVVSSKYVIPSVFENNYFNPLCFLQYYNPITPPNQWKEVLMCVYIVTYVCYLHNYKAIEVNYVTI